MSRKHLNPARLALVTVVALGTTGAAITEAGAASPFSVCYDRATRVLHFSPTGRCYGAKQIHLIVGAPATGARGPRGARGLGGVAGAQGDAGLAGAAGANGAQGIQGLQGPQGIQGPAGGSGVNGTNGINGGTGAGGTNGANGGTGVNGAVGGSGTNGAAGGTGPQGAPGANTFETHFTTVSSPSDPGNVTAMCPSGSIATGGGYVGSAGRILASRPTLAGDGWFISWNSPDVGAITAYAICAVGTSTTPG